MTAAAPGWALGPIPSEPAPPGSQRAGLLGRPASPTLPWPQNPWISARLGLMAVPGSIPKGTILSGKYAVGRELGRGGMAAVYRAENIDIHKKVAIKLLAGHLATSQTVVERFLREARAVAKIKSPHICDVYDSGRLDDGTPFLVMELLEGESLYDAMCRDRQMSPELTLAIILQVARGLSRAHEVSIVHRDLKPENIFLTVDEDGQLLTKILDFGLAKFYDPMETKGKGRPARLTREGAVFGTPAYMSPEQVRGQAAADTRADLWALACITYECFTGTTVWSTDEGVAMTFAQIATAPLPDPLAYRPDLPQSFVDWFRKALHRDIKERFQSVREFADGLAAAFGHTAAGGGLDVGLVNLITNRATHGVDGDAVTQRRSTSGPPPAPPTSSLEPEPRRSPGPPPSASPSPVELQRAEQLSLSMARPRSRWKAKAVVGTILAALAGAAVYSLVTAERPAPVMAAKRLGDDVTRLASTDSPEVTGFKFVAKHPWLPGVREAQALVGNGDYDAALDILRRLHDTHRHPLIRNLVDQVQVAIAGRQGSAGCQTMAFARPRRYDLLAQDVKAVDATAPRIAFGLSGVLMSWADAHDGRRRAYAVPLDDVLRNRALPVDITPEGNRVATPTLLPSAQRFLAVYWDSGGPAAGAYLRWLRPDGVIGGAPLAVTERGGAVYHATAARAGDGFVVAWSEQEDADSIDLYFRRFDAEAKALGEPVRITDYINLGPSPSRVREVEVFEAGGKLHFAYTFARGAVQHLRYQAVPTDSAAPGLEPLKTGKREERTLAAEVELTSPSDPSNEPSLGCIEEGCFVAWDQAMRRGAGVAFIDAKTGTAQWHKLFASQGRHPTLAVAPSGDVQLAWVEGSRLATASLSRSGVGPVSKVARVVGDHPPPSLAPGAKRGEWYVTWLDYESGHREPYAARIECK